VNIKKIAAVFGNQAVDQGDFRPEMDQAPGEGRADETQSAGNENV
jgi:hypothetical protein